MTQLAARPRRSDYPHYYGDFTIVLNQGRFYGIPGFLDPARVHNRLTTHPAILSASSRAELEALIRDYDSAWYQQQLVDWIDGYALIRYRGAVYAVPEATGPVDLDSAEERRHAGVLRGGSCDEIQQLVRQRTGSSPVEFAGWLPIFEASGNLSLIHI